MLKEKISPLFRNFSFGLLFIPVFLSSIGLVSIYSSSKDGLFIFEKQLFFLILGIFLFFIFSSIDFRILKESPLLIYFLYFFSLVLLVLTYLFAPEIRGTRTWLKFLFFSFDPIEILKVSLLLFFAYYFSKKHVQMYNLPNILISGSFAFLPAFFIFLQPNAASAFLIIFLWIFLLLLSGIKLRHFFILILIFSLLFGISWVKLFKPYQKERISSFFKSGPSDSLSLLWSKNQSEIAIGSGGPFGKGIKNGPQVQLGFLPEPRTDFIFAAICEEMGFVFGFLILFFLFVLTWQIISVGEKTNFNFSKLFCFGCAALIFIEAFVNLGVNLGILPTAGISLPFISYGGSNLISKFISLGIVQNIKKTGR